MFNKTEPRGRDVVLVRGDDDVELRSVESKVELDLGGPKVLEPC